MFKIDKGFIQKSKNTDMSYWSPFYLLMHYTQNDNVELDKSEYRMSDTGIYKRTYDLRCMKHMQKGA